MAWYLDVHVITQSMCTSEIRIFWHSCCPDILVPWHSNVRVIRKYRWRTDDHPMWMTGLSGLMILLGMVRFVGVQARKSWHGLVHARKDSCFPSLGQPASCGHSRRSNMFIWPLLTCYSHLTCVFLYFAVGSMWHLPGKAILHVHRISRGISERCLWDSF